ncbi:MAG TPA: IS5 family transposase, partial [Candidatus Sulfotelmatobacter sp.]|nr:IS5 family transposase [Candidatus Sulfotelmatobacter sp.]
QRVPASHPLRGIRRMVDEALAELSEQFDELYATTGRPSIAPEKLLRALLLQALYGKRSERLLMEELDYSLLFRWFVGLAIDDPVWDATVFSKNRDRLIGGEIASRFFVAVRVQLEKSGVLSDEHFTVDGTMLEAWANRRSFREKANPPERGSGPGGKRLLRDTHESRTDPEARLYRKCNAGAAEPSYLGHVLTENDHGLIVAACVTEAGTRAERDAALALLDQRRSRKRRTLGADKQYQERQFVEALRARNIVPHVAEYERGNLQRNSLRADEREGPEFVQSQKKRKLVEQSFAWIKHWAGFWQVKLRSRRRVEWLFQIAAAAYNLVRMTRLRPALG